MTCHEINKLLADVAGVEVWLDSNNSSSWECCDKKGLFVTWTPLTDYNQMALVKNTLLESHLGMRVHIFKQFSIVYIGGEFAGESDCWRGRGDNEMQAFGNAVAKMWQTGVLEAQGKEREL